MILKGEKIYIRSLIKSDANQIFKNANDKYIAKFTTITYPYKIEYAYKFIQQSQINIKTKKSFALGIFLKESDDFTGLISLDKVDLNKKNCYSEST